MVDWDWTRVVFDHVKLGVSDVEASKRFYKTVLAALEIPPLWENERGAQFANLVLSGTAEVTAPLHIGFVARSREEVDAFHTVGIDAGYRDNGPPGIRDQYSSKELRGVPARPGWIASNIEETISRRGRDSVSRRVTYFRAAACFS